MKKILVICLLLWVSFIMLRVINKKKFSIKMTPRAEYGKPGCFMFDYYITVNNKLIPNNVTGKLYSKEEISNLFLDKINKIRSTPVSRNTEFINLAKNHSINTAKNIYFSGHGIYVNDNIVTFTDRLKKFGYKKNINDVSRVDKSSYNYKEIFVSIVSDKLLNNNDVINEAMNGYNKSPLHMNIITNIDNKASCTFLTIYKYNVTGKIFYKYCITTIFRD